MTRTMFSCGGSGWERQGKAVNGGKGSGGGGGREDYGVIMVKAGVLIPTYV